MISNLLCGIEDAGMLRPIFIGGCPRSGTTMLGAILGEAANCFASPETIFKQHVMERLNSQGVMSLTLAEFLNIISNEIPFWRMNLNDCRFPKTVTRENVRSVIDIILRKYAASQSKINVRTWIDHTPPNILNSLLLNEFYPDAKFIHIIRDPRGVAASSMQLPWGPNSPREFSTWWAFHIAHGLAMERHFRERCFRVRYEDILSNPESTVQAICKFCEIPFNHNMLLAQKLLIPSFSVEQHSLVGMPPIRDRALAWKRELNPISAWKVTSLLGELIDVLGFDRGLINEPKASFVELLKWAMDIGIQKALSPLRRKQLRISRRRLRLLEELNSNLNGRVVENSGTPIYPIRYVHRLRDKWPGRLMNLIARV